MVFSIAVHTTLFVRVHTANFTGGLTSIWRQQGLKSHPALEIFILILLSFAGATTYWASSMVYYTIQIHSVLMKNIGMELSEKFALANAATEVMALIQTVSDPFVVS